MDVNGAKFHLIYGLEDWRGNEPELPNKLKWDKSGGCLTLRPDLFRFPVTTNYLFCWGEIPGKDSEKILDFINQKFDISLIEPKIEKIDNTGVINVYDEKNVISLKLNYEQNRINIEINNKLSYKLTVKKEDKKLNIYSTAGEVAPSYRRGADIDRYGNIYWIDDSRQNIRILNSGSRTSSHFWSSDDLNDECKNSDFQNEKKESHEALLFSGLAVTENHYLIAGVVSPPGFLVFDLISGGSPVQMYWKKDADSYLFDWNEVQRNDRDKLIKFVEDKFGLIRAESALIEKINENKMKISIDNRSIFLELNNEKTTVSLFIDDSRRCELIVEKENGKMNVYKAFFPFDIARVPGGGVLILDNENKKCHKLDRNLSLTSSRKKTIPADIADFKPEKVEDEQITTYQSIKNSYDIEAQNPVSIVAISDDSFVVLDNDYDAGYSSLLFYRNGKFVRNRILREATEKNLDKEQSYSILGHDITFIPDLEQKKLGKLYIATAGGNQAYAFKILEMVDDFEIYLLPEYYPMRLFSGKALVSDGKNAYYDLNEKWLRIIEQPVPLFERKGELYTRVFDGKEINCVWHRFFLDAYIPQGASVRVESKAANLENIMENIEWHEEPRLYLRRTGTEIPYYNAYPGQRTEGKGTWEFLFQHAVGRYLAIRLTIEGDGTNSPALRAIRIHYPRFSYMKKYLPSVYQDDPVSASFLDRYLANVEGTFTEIEGRIQNAEVLFDAWTIPSEYMDWLAGWLGIILESDWDDMRKRLFLSHAVSLFRERGTVSGLLRTIRLAIDPSPDDMIFKTDFTIAEQTKGSVRIVEKYRLRKAPGVVYGDPLEARGPGMTTDISRWKPEDGALYIHDRFIAFLKNRYRIKGESTLDSIIKAWGTNCLSYLFGWDNIPGNDSGILIDFLKKNYNIEVNPENIEKIDNTIIISDENNYLLLSLNENEVNLKIDDGRTDKFIARTENGEMKVYYFSFEKIRFPPVLPDDPTAANDWKFFLKNWLGFMYAEVSPGHLGLYRNFLRKRYRKIQELNLIHHSALESFEQVSLPSVLPADETVLSDWIQFVSTVLPIRLNAHRFIVLVPQKPDEGDDAINKRMEIVKRIVRKEKPAHTIFEIKPYYSLLRVGEARLGIDTELGKSCRFTSISLGKGKLAEGSLASYRPDDLKSRIYVWD